MRTMGIQAVYPKPRTTVWQPAHAVYPYLLRGLAITRPNQVWAADITYCPMERGFVYLVAIMDWYTRKYKIDTVFNFNLFFTKFPFFFASFSFGGSTPKPPRYLCKGDVT